ncbi:MAG: 16S rRNA (adenine(1518)-N(6)/adenine(1519)-N(6))-dimethyltransferase RsmA [Gammaproteobacteria bacterium]|nr:16S rRNA (adenine(1518)-N(6)/adenine(1519)-N(6))-dimethyltransferase RsmA [Gammaproteobacteria bacterium]
MKGSFQSPRKSLGQNFLQDSNIIRKIVASLNIGVDDVVLEIGPGRGALTDQILPLARQLHVVEFDRDLSAYWRQRAESAPNLVVHEADILKFELAGLLQGQSIAAEGAGKLKIIGNLPYNISTPVLFHLMRYADQVDSQVLMLQKEVVLRMASPPGTKQYGRLSIMLQYRYAIENLFTVSPAAFIPPPKVESAIVRLTPLPKIEHTVANTDDFSRIVKAAFSQRRKTLRNTLKGYLSVKQIEIIGVHPTVRAETLAVEDFVKLANLYTKVKDDSYVVPGKER